MRFSIRFTFALKEGCEIKRLAAAGEISFWQQLRFREFMFRHFMMSHTKKTVQLHPLHQIVREFPRKSNSS